MLVYLSLGSNLGDRLQYLESALDVIRKETVDGKLRLSGLYETRPVEYDSDERYLNLACGIDVGTQPAEYLPSLMYRLLQIEKTVGDRRRDPTKSTYIDRTLDIDILAAVDKDGTVLQKSWTKIDASNQQALLTIPHPRACDRQFILKCLVDIDPDLKLSSSSSTVRELLGKLQGPDLVVPVFAATNRLLWPCERFARAMLAVNLTTDSFSGSGGAVALCDDSGVDVEAATRYIMEMLGRYQWSILDLGAESTAPGRKEVTGSVQLSRLLPVLRRLAQIEEFMSRDLLVTIDTRSSEVLAECHKVMSDRIGVNDVSGFRYDSKLAEFVKTSHIPAVVCHSLGTPETMKKEEEERYSDDPERFCEQFSSDFDSLADQVLSTDNLFPWRVILDPGLGFGKTGMNSATLMRNSQWLRKIPSHIPVCLGISRKLPMLQAGLTLVKEQVRPSSQSTTADSTPTSETRRFTKDLESLDTATRRFYELVIERNFLPDSSTRLLIIRTHQHVPGTEQPPSF